MSLHYLAVYNGCAGNLFFDRPGSFTWADVAVMVKMDINLVLYFMMPEVNYLNTL